MNKLIIALFGLLLLGGCTAQTTTDDARIRVVTTIGMITDIVQNVGGDYVRVTGLMGPGVDPHLYKTSEGDVRAMSSTDIIFYNGLHLESKMGDVIEGMEQLTHVVAVTDYLNKSELLDFPAFPGQYDPHVWFNVKYWMNATQKVRDELIRYDPAHAQYYKDNAQTYQAGLEALDAYVTAQIQRVPEQQRVLITAHDAFSYFGREYGLDVRGLQGISTEAQAGTGDVQELVDFIVLQKIKAIFIESSVPERNIKAVEEAVEAKGWNVSIGGELFSDAMGDAGTFEGTYIGMVTHNVDTIVGALS
ncbi:manganese transporter [archaeon CG10_big_fil_rev_8_21_14_0_10_43_11]|nr:MAG: manganese transporter [archaeon CG10_big_fil_rev_8_21_14_0_10_43_11]